jgi:hypothetical protein
MLWYMVLGLGLLTGSSIYMQGQYALPATTQSTIVRWAPLADYIGRKADVPREIPLVLWLKENSMQAINPESCTGIMGTYDLVRSGEHPCFEPGPISDLAVSEQLTIGAMEFKKRCPEVTYWTQNPQTLQKCYLAYNAGISAAQNLDPTASAYVMNGYNDSYQDMVYQDIELGTVTVTALGAWPAHLAIQSIITTQIEGESKPVSFTALDLGTRIYDWATYNTDSWFGGLEAAQGEITFAPYRPLSFQECLAEPHTVGLPSLRPIRNPIAEDPILTQDIHGCSYGLPGLDISSNNRSALLYAPMPGELTTYTDQWYNTTIRIENSEWIVWLLHARSYLVESGAVKRGEAVGVMGAVGYATGPHVHYAVFDKLKDTFVDPAQLLPN